MSRVIDGSRSARTVGSSRSLEWILLLVVAFVGGPLGATALAGMPDWNGVADVETVEVLTKDQDGAARETTVWLLVQDGEGYVRTGNTTWGGNVVRDGELTLRIGGQEYPLRVEFVEDESARERLTRGFREKYGWSDALIGWIRGSHPRIMHLVSR
ncbi:MAG TPA: DUF2255 family protein [Deltaproteobacteria bacterium]|nr:DUF2255 family protein [Deltaproteobacteria bacterium]